MDANNIDQINKLVNKILNCTVYEKSNINDFKNKYFENTPSKKIIKILKESI